MLGPDEPDRIILAERGEKGTRMLHLTEDEIDKARTFMVHEASLSDYWMYSDLEMEEE